MGSGDEYGLKNWKQIQEMLKWVFRKEKCPK